MRFEDVPGVFASRLTEAGFSDSDGVYGREALERSWSAFLDLAREPVEAELAVDQRRLFASQDIQHDVLLHESLADPVFRVVFERRIDLVDHDGKRSGRLVVELEVRCPDAELDRVPRATRWGGARGGPEPDEHPHIGRWTNGQVSPSRWAGDRDQWAAKVVTTNSWKALEAEQPVELRFRTRTETWPRLELPATVDASEEAIVPLQQAFAQVGFEPGDPGSPEAWWTAVSQWVSVPARSDGELNGDMLMFEASVQKGQDHPRDTKPLGFTFSVTRQFVFTGEDGWGGLEAVFMEFNYELNDDVLELVAHNNRGWCNMETFWARGTPEEWVVAVEATPAFRSALRHKPTSFRVSYEPVG